MYNIKNTVLKLTSYLPIQEVLNFLQSKGRYNTSDSEYTITSDLVILSQWLNDHSYLKIHSNFQLLSAFYNRPHS